VADETDELLERARAGDERAISALVVRHLPSLRAYVRLRGGPLVRRCESDSDLVQSICVEILRNLQNVRYQGEGPFRHWLFTIALRKLVEKERYYRAEKRNPDRLAAPAEGDSESINPLVSACYAKLGTPSEVAIQRETSRRIEEALDAMPENYRDVILMSRLMGLSHAEIAERLGKSEAAVRTTLSRALARVARILAE
jgi:RNA polymerase sigma-70 factor, ECF subfamily